MTRADWSRMVRDLPAAIVVFVVGLAFVALLLSMGPVPR